MHRSLSLVNVGLRGFMETGLVAGFATWGYWVAPGGGSGLLLAVLAPVAVFGFWGAVDFRFAGSIAEPLRLVQELALTGLAAVAFYVAGQHALGVILAGISVLHHGLVYALGERLLKESPGRPSARASARQAQEGAAPHAVR